MNCHSSSTFFRCGGESPGGMRDVHLLRWIALPRYGTRDPQMLRAARVTRGFAPTAQKVEKEAEGAEGPSRRGEPSAVSS